MAPAVENLTIGSEGADVSLLHRELEELGLSVGAEEVSTKAFGQSTQQSVMTFQRQQGLPVTGIVDAASAERLSREVAKFRFVVRGSVRSADGRAIAAANVQAFDKDLRSEE